MGEQRKPGPLVEWWRTLWKPFADWVITDARSNPDVSNDEYQKLKAIYDEMYTGYKEK